MIMITRQHLKPCTHNQRDLGPIITESNFLIPHNKQLGMVQANQTLPSMHSACKVALQRQALITASYSNQTTSNAFLPTVEPEKEFLKTGNRGNREAATRNRDL
jgi:hypothetical protein